MNTAYRLHNETIKTTDGTPPKPLASVVGFYPGANVTQMWKDDVAGTREAAEMFTGGRRSSTRTATARCPRPPTSTPACPAPCWWSGTAIAVPAEPITAFGDALKKKGVDTEVKELPFAEHAFDDAYGSLTSQTSRQILLDFLTKDAR